MIDKLHLDIEKPLHYENIRQKIGKGTINEREQVILSTLQH